VFDGPVGLVEGEATAAVEVPLRRFHASGALEGVLRQTLRLDAGNADTMSLVLESVQLGLVGAPTSYEVVLRVIASGPIPVDALLFSLTLEEALAEMGGPATGVAAGSADSIPGLSARPSTFRESTRFELAEPVARNESLRVYDVQGRLVRRLTVPAGTRGVTWNGRDDAGERVGSGVYFAHLAAREPMTAKVTTVR
jgi:hypothetical protein